MHSNYKLYTIHGCNSYLNSWICNVKENFFLLPFSLLSAIVFLIFLINLFRICDCMIGLLEVVNGTSIGTTCSHRRKQKCSFKINKPRLFWAMPEVLLYLHFPYSKLFIWLLNQLMGILTKMAGGGMIGQLLRRKLKTQSTVRMVPLFLFFFPWRTHLTNQIAQL